MNKIIIAILATASLAFAAEGQAGNRPRFDTDGDKALNKTEWLARASHRFDIVDTNKDGVVSREERRAAIKHLSGKHRERVEGRNNSK